MRLYEIISEYGVPDYNTMPTYKLKRAKKGKHKFFVPSNEPTPKGVQAIENVTDHPEITQSKKEEIINAWEYQEDLIDIGNGYRILSGENHGRADNVALLIGPDYKIKDEDDNIEDLLDNNFGIIMGEGERNLNPAVKDYIKGKKTKLIKVKVADLDDEAIDDRFGRVIDPDPDVGVDLDDPILLDVDGKTILDGFHRVYQAKRVGRDVIPAEIIDENFDDDDFVEYYDEIHPVVISAWKSVYPNVPLKTYDDEDLYMQYTTADEYLPHGGNGKDFYLSLGVQYMGDEEPPMGYINVGDAYAGNYKGVVAKIIADLFEWLEKKHPNMGVRELGIHMNRNAEAWSAIAQKVGAQLEKRGYYENFADGKVKGKSRPGRVKKAGASCKGSVSSLRAKAKKYSGEKGKMYHWCANMKSGKSNS
jgi:hypothetical protein